MDAKKIIMLLSASLSFALSFILALLNENTLPSALSKGFISFCVISAFSYLLFKYIEKNIPEFYQLLSKMLNDISTAIYKKILVLLNLDVPDFGKITETFKSQFTKKDLKNESNRKLMKKGELKDGELFKNDLGEEDFRDDLNGADSQDSMIKTDKETEKEGVHTENSEYLKVKEEEKEIFKKNPYKAAMSVRTVIENK